MMACTGEEGGDGWKERMEKDVRGGDRHRVTVMGGR